MRRSAPVLILVGCLAVAFILLWTLLDVISGQAATGTLTGVRSPADRAANVVRAEFGHGPLAGCMFAIVARETGWTFDPRAANWDDRHADGSRGSFGLFQIGALWRKPGEPVAAFARRMYNPAANARLAHRLYRRHGYQPWGGC